MSWPRPSLFTFSSALHSSNVLRALNELRLEEVLCDVAVTTAEGRSFRAHAAVLAACSRYFHCRLQGSARERRSVTLPPEVTAEGFEPLLNFAYTSQLLFSKDNIRSIYHCAELLGFQDLETSCFDFLLPKFCEDKRPSQTPPLTPPPPMACCEKPPSESASETPTQQPETTVSKGLTLETCGPQMTPLTLDAAASGVCPMLRCGDSGEADRDEGNASDQSELQDRRRSRRLQAFRVRAQTSRVQPQTSGVQPQTSGVQAQTSRVQPQTSRVQAQTSRVQQEEVIQQPSDESRDQCPFRAEASCEPNAAVDLLQTSIRVLNPDEEFADHNEEFMETSEEFMDTNEEFMDRSEEFSETTEGFADSTEGFAERSSVEREVAEHLARGFWSDLCPEPEGPPKAEDFHWQLDLSSSVGECPFFRQMKTAEDEPETMYCLSPCHSSSAQSGTESETDPDSEANQRRAEEMQLPFPVEKISALSRSAFQQVLKRKHLTSEQQEFVQDVRRRSKNRVAAQRCRKRKLDDIQQLEADISVLRMERERLLQERTELRLSLEQTRQDLCSLGLDSGLDSETSPDYTKDYCCPISESSLGSDQDLDPSSDRDLDPPSDRGLDPPSDRGLDPPSDLCLSDRGLDSSSDRGLDPPSDPCPSDLCPSDLGPSGLGPSGLGPSGLSLDPEPSLEQTEEHFPLLDMSPVTPSSSSCPLSASLFMDMDSF